MFGVFYIVNLCIYDLFHILLPLWHINGSVECMYVYMHVCVYFFFFYYCIKHDPSLDSNTTRCNNVTSNNVSSCWFLIIGRRCRACLCTWRRSLHFLYNVLPLFNKFWLFVITLSVIVFQSLLSLWISKMISNV